MRWRIHLHHEHGTHNIPNVIEGDTVNVPEGLAIRSVGLEPEPNQSVIAPTAVPGGPSEPHFGETPMEPTSPLLADESGILNKTATTASSVGVAFGEPEEAP